LTAPHTTPPLLVEKVDDAVAALRSRGLRVSAARRLVLEMLFAAREPLTAERIAAGVEGGIPQSDPASVYRNLETLEEVGLVRHFHLGHGPGQYTLASGADWEFLSCESCGELQSVESTAMDGVRDTIREAFGFEAGFHHFPIVGLCSACAATSRVDADATDGKEA
jgi:Fur family transcriptional regulator, ferric uptake regulator